MNKGAIEAAKKFFGKHFKNQFKKIDSWDELPKVFKIGVFGYGDGERMFEKYKSIGQFYAVITPESRYLVHISPKREGEVQVVDEKDRIIKPSDVEFQLNLPILGLTLKELLEGLFEEKEEEFSDLSESDLNRLVKKVIKEQANQTGNDRIANIASIMQSTKTVNQPTKIIVSQNPKLNGMPLQKYFQIFKVTPQEFQQAKALITKLGGQQPQLASGGASKPQATTGGIPKQQKTIGGVPQTQATTGGAPKPTQGAKPQATTGGAPKPTQGAKPQATTGGAPKPTQKVSKPNPNDIG